MNEPDLLEQKRLLATDVACFLKSDICVSCSGELTNPSAVLLRVPIKRGDQVYNYICLELCGACCGLKDYNKTKRGLSYWLSEGSLEVISRGDDAST